MNQSLTVAFKIQASICKLMQISLKTVAAQSGRKLACKPAISLDMRLYIAKWLCVALCTHACNIKITVK